MKVFALCLLFAVLLTGCVSEETPADTSSAATGSKSTESSTPSDESIPGETSSEGWTESVTKGNTTTTTEYVDEKNYTVTTETVNDDGALILKLVKEYRNSALYTDKRTEYHTDGEAYCDYTTYYDESGEPVRFVDMDRGQTYIVYHEGTYESDGSSQATVRYESLDGVLLAEGTERAYIDSGVRYDETIVSVYDETGACDHREKHVYGTELSYRLWEYSDADGNVIFAHATTGNAKEVARAGENGGIISIQGTEYSFADINGVVFAKATMENNHLTIYEVYDIPTEEAPQRAQALWEYILAFDKLFFLQTVHFS